LGPTVDSDRFRAVALALIATAFLAGCAASHPETKKEEPAGVSVHLPALEPMDIETRTQPPVVQPELSPLPSPHSDVVPGDDVETGKARSLNLIDIHLDGGKPSKPAGSVPTEPEQKP
jgi:PBP1b-binding outer membrane lipoprotein LpoB